MMSRWLRRSSLQPAALQSTSATGRIRALVAAALETALTQSLCVMHCQALRAPGTETEQGGAAPALGLGRGLCACQDRHQSHTVTTGESLPPSLPQFPLL